MRDSGCAPSGAGGGGMLVGKKSTHGVCQFYSLKFIGKVPVFSLESSIFVVSNLTGNGLIVLF